MELCIDKYRCYHYLHLFNMPQTAICTKENLELFINKYGKAIIKPIKGSNGNKVMLLDKAIDVADKDFIVQQPIIPKEFFYDIRVFIQNKKEIYKAMYARVATDSFITNISAGGQV